MKPVTATVALILVLVMLVLPVFPQDIQAAGEGDIAELRQKAEQGDAEAQTSLGAMYDTGEGVAQDYREALRWYRLAADQGHLTAQRTLGVMYRQGKALRDAVVDLGALVQFFGGFVTGLFVGYVIWN